MISFEKHENVTDAFLPTGPAVALVGFERGEEPAHAHLSDWHAGEEAGHVPQLGRVVLLNQGKQVLLVLLQGPALLSKLIDATIDRSDELAFHLSS